MKNALPPFFLLLLVLTIACQNDDDAAPTSVVVPAWLQAQIDEDEAVIASDSSRLENYGAWIRYSFKNEFYYEYDNPLSSSFGSPFSEEGDVANLSNPFFTNYQNERCCARYIWEGPRYLRRN